MAQDNVIPRRQSDPDGLDFAGLREQGVALLQALAGEEWTDYNLHDPGVTLLEMLVYGLTDLLYRTGFPVADMLATESGRIEYARQALFEPQHILPGAPVTLLDYRKLIYDALPGIDDVWLQSVSDANLPAGLLAIYVKPHDPMFAAPDGADVREPAANLVEQVIALFAAQRNLCQDLHEVRVVQSEPYFLCGEIEIDDTRLPAEIYADIYFQCARLISAGGRMQRYEEALAAGKQWDELLRGPLTEHGYLDDAAFASARYQIDVVKLITLVLRIPGVKQVRHLSLTDAAQQVMDNLECDPQQHKFPALQFPRQVADLQLLQLVTRRTPQLDTRLGLNYVPKESLPQDGALLEQVRLILKKREFEHQAFRRNQSNLPRMLNLPQGTRHALHEYVSVSIHAPPIYGINRFGIPRSEPPEVHARARQLKAYLYPFEQIMANYLQSLQDLPHLYSLDTGLQQTYFAQFLSDAQVPDLDVLYRDGTTKAEVAAVLARYDPYCERRHRVLDSLLAMYGETFPTDSLRRFNHYRVQDGEQWLIECKIACLAHLCELSARRGMAQNVAAPYWQGGNAASLQKKISLLIGAGPLAGYSLLAHLHTSGTAATGSATAGPATAGQTGGHAGGHAFVSAQRYKAQLPLIDTRTATRLVLHDKPWFAPSAAVPHGLLCLEVLRAGIDLANYRLLPAGKQVWLCLQVAGEVAPWPLWQLASQEVPVRVLQLQAHLIALNRQSEGLHLLEHILLRPHDEQSARDQEPSFYANRVSVVLPAISSRFADPAFRIWVEELVAQQLPAHIYPEFYWLDYVYLQDFEQRYKKWLGLLASWNGNHLAMPSAAGAELAAQLDQAAGKLIAFLHKNRAQQPTGYWI